MYTPELIYYGLRAKSGGLKEKGRFLARYSRSKVKRQVKKHPFASLIGATAIGLLAGMLLAPRRSSARKN